MSRLTLLLIAALATTAALAAAGGGGGNRPVPSKRPPPPPASPSSSPTSGGGGGGGAAAASPAPSKLPKPDFGSLFGFNGTAVPPQLPGDVRGALEDVLKKAGKDGGSNVDVNAPPPLPGRDEVTDELRKAAKEAIRVARNNSLVDPEGRPFIRVDGPNGTYILKTFNALNHARCNITTLLDIAGHWVSLPAGERFVRGINNDSVLIVGASPHNRFGRGRRSHHVHSDIIDISITDSTTGEEIYVNSTTLIDDATVNITIVTDDTTADGEKQSCAWWDEVNGEWSTDGCTTVQQDGYLECTCNHLTSFAAVSGGGGGASTPDSSSVNVGAIVGGVVGGVALIALVVGAVFGIKSYKRTQANKALVSNQGNYKAGYPNVVVVVPSQGAIV